MEDANLWDRIDASRWFRILPPSNTAQAWSEECDSVVITLDAGTYWLNNPNRAGQADYATLKEAMKAGDELLDELEAAVGSDLARGVGLDIEVWEYADVDGLHMFRRKDGLSEFIFRAADHDSWFAVRGEDELETVSTPLDAAASLSLSHTPR